MIPVITTEMSSRKKMGGCTARLFVQNFDAVLVVIIISAGDAIFAKFHKTTETRKNTYFKIYGMLFFPGGGFLRPAVDSKGPVAKHRPIGAPAGVR